ncbi:NupC/NupG family nucleoside CNT transporter [Pantanalinema rosaneae CENA516]|uniref:NupC/NupG family nucleoside CNT transporter n=1 Tax=Pantanalinema rosaneae TaxID=1620701 RepID=UPI003D6DBDF5
MSVLNAISFFGIFGLCLIAWAFSENRRPRYFPWRVVIMGILLQLVLGALVFLFPPTRDGLDAFSKGLDSVFAAAEFGANFVFGSQIVPKVYGDNPPLGYIFAFRALPTVVFFSGLMALLYNIGVIQVITNIFAKVFYTVMRLSGAEALSGAANIFVGIEAAIVVKPYLPKMTRSEICAILACCFGTSASSTLAIYVSFLRPVFPNILAHLVSASIIAIPACFVISKILVPETEIPVTARGLPKEEKRVKLRVPANKRELLADANRSFPGQEIPTTDEDEEITRLLRGEAPLASTPPVREREEPEELISEETVAGEPMERMSPMDAAIGGAIDGVKMAVAIAAVLILILGFVSLINQMFAGLAMIPGPVGDLFKVLSLQNILGFLFVPVTFLTGISLEPSELWQSSVIIGRRFFETAIPPYLALASASQAGQLSDRAVVIISYALSGFAHLASVGIFVGGMIALIPSRRKDISSLGWKALFVGTLATIMIACVAGVFYTPGNASSILGDKQAVPPAASPSPSPTPAAPASPQAAPGTPVAPVASPAPSPDAAPPPASPVPPAPEPSPTATQQSWVQPGEGQSVVVEEALPTSDQQSYSEATSESES